MNPFVEDEGAREYFVGRHDEVRRITQWLADASDGQGISAIVTGLHGTGKTSVLERAAELAEESKFSVVTSLCSESSTTYQQMCSLIVKCAVAADAQPTAAPSLKGEWTDSSNGPNPKFLLPTVEYPDPSAFEHDLKRVVDVVGPKTGSTGLVLAVDEAQYLTREFLSILRNVVRALRKTPLLILLAVRVETATHGAAASGREWVRDLVGSSGGDPGLERFLLNQIALGPFDGSTAREALERRLADVPKDLRFPDDVIRSIASVSGGNPRQLVKLAHEVFELQRTREKRADQELFERAFRETFPEAIAIAQNSLNGMDDTMKGLLKVLVETRSSLSPKGIGELLYEQKYRSDPEEVTRRASAQLEKLEHQCAGVVSRGDGTYGMQSELSRLAARLVMS